MEEHVLWITRVVNQILGPLAAALLSRLHILPANPETPIPQHVVMGMIALLIGTLFALIVRMRLSVEKPGATQQVAELLLTNPMEFGIRDLLVENSGRDGARYVPFVGAISIFVLISNLMAVFPFFLAPTGVVSVPLACAILTFLYFNFHGTRHHGIGGYLKTFAGNPHGVAGGCWHFCCFVEIISDARVCFRSQFVCGPTCLPVI
jgi:F-type H+-transporting ATPase subunit a